jgi:hypothetical protein
VLEDIKKRGLIKQEIENERLWEQRMIGDFSITGMYKMEMEKLYVRAQDGFFRQNLITSSNCWQSSLSKQLFTLWTVLHRLVCYYNNPEICPKMQV